MATLQHAPPRPNLDGNLRGENLQRHDVELVILDRRMAIKGSQGPYLWRARAQRDRKLHQVRSPFVEMRGGEQEQAAPVFVEHTGAVNGGQPIGCLGGNDGHAVPDDVLIEGADFQWRHGAASDNVNDGHAKGSPRHGGCPRLSLVRAFGPADKVCVLPGGDRRLTQRPALRGK